VRDEIRQIFDGFFPQIFGLMSIQLNLLVASGIAWLFSGPSDERIRWLGRVVEFPMTSGAAAAIYYSERLFEFPQGLIGLAVATAIYPLLSRHAANQDFRSFGDDLTLGARILFVLAIPAGVGLMLLSEKLAHLLFQRGAFTPMDTFRTADMIFWFGVGVWAFCALPLIIRAFYVVGDYWTPCRVGFFGCVLNAILGLTLIWPMQEQGLAVVASLTAGIQSVVLLLIFAKRHEHFDFRSFFLSVGRACIATALMAIVVVLTMKLIPGQSSKSDIVHIVAGGGVGVFVFFSVHRLLGGRELGILVRGKERKTIRRQRNNRKKK
jgi:putative peptidoglycan lipid II flippase